MGRKSKDNKSWDISDYVSCLSILKDRFYFKIVETFPYSEHSTELKTKDLSMALYKFFLALDTLYIHRVQLLIIDKENPLFPIIVADKYVYQSRKNI